jgi:hypothetical protein
LGEAGPLLLVLVLLSADRRIKPPPPELASAPGDREKFDGAGGDTDPPPPELLLFPPPHCGREGREGALTGAETAMAGDSALATTGVPHSPQNIASASSCSPQSRQNGIALLFFLFC